MSAFSQVAKIVCMFSSINFDKLDFTSGFMICFELFFIWFEVRVELYLFICEYPVVPAPFVGKGIFSSLNFLGTFVKNQLTINV